MSEGPRRVQLRRTKGWKMPAGAKKVDRSTPWGNPFGTTQRHHCFAHRGLPAPCVALRVDPSLDRCIDMFTGYLEGRLRADPDFLEPLRGKDLACWCALDQPCHADVLMIIANRTPAVLRDGLVASDRA